MENLEHINRLKELKKIIEGMDAIHHPKILEILKTNNIHVSSNRNGCFINMNNFDETIFTKLNNFIKYINVQEQTLGAVEKQKTDLNNTFFNNKKKDNKENVVLSNNQC
tara:strand:- start:103 stop:429 length:327 start_codon:yes stop_codon:yes gene_type:complete